METNLFINIQKMEHITKYTHLSVPADIEEEVETNMTHWTRIINFFEL